MSLLVKLASSAAERPMPSFELVLSRSIIQCLGAFFYLRTKGISTFGVSRPLDSFKHLSRLSTLKARFCCQSILGRQDTPIDTDTTTEGSLLSPLSPVSTERVLEADNIFRQRDNEHVVLGWLMFRGFSGSIGLAMFYFALTALPLADATVIFFTGPPMTSLLAWVVLGESLDYVDVISAAACLLGVVLVARPEFLFGPHELSPSVGDVQSGLRTWGVFAALTGAFISAVAYTTVRKITRLKPGLHAMVHVFMFGLISTFVSPIGMALFGQKFVVPKNAQEWGLLLGVGVMALLGQIMLNRGLQLVDAGPGTLMRNLDVVFAFVFGVTLLHEKVEWTSYVGACIIIVFAVGTGLKKWYMKSRRQSVPSRPYSS